jgi:hypothetical protein
MKARRRLALLLSLSALLALPAAAKADFGFVPGSVKTTALNKNGTLTTQASSHPYSYTVDFKLKTDSEGRSEGGEMRDAIVDLPPGLVGSPLAVPRCTRQDFEGLVPQCSPDTQVGVLRPTVPSLGQLAGPVYNLVPPPGVAAQLGFSAAGLNGLLNASARTEDGYGVAVTTNSIPLEVTVVSVTIWGVPADPGHDAERGNALQGNPPVSSSAPLLPFLTLPASCSAPLETTVSVDSKLDPGHFVSASAQSLDSGGQPAALSGCGAVPFKPKIAAAPTSRAGESASGLDFELKLPNEGLLNPGGIAETEPHKVEVALPEGVTANPSAAEGLGVCTQAQYKAEQLESKAGEGCPEAAKLGSIVAHSPLIEEPVEGALYLAEPYANPSGSLIAIYIVARAPERGVLIKQAGKVEPDPATGRLITTFEDLPPLPYSDFRLHFREGARGPLVTPSSCGSYVTSAKLYPFSDPANPTTATASFQIERGVNGGPCHGGPLPFNPGFEAGTLNNSAARHSPLHMRLRREDGDQDLTKLSTTLPPGLLASLAGVGKCSDAQIAAAKARSGPHGGAEEQSSPSCPASSQIGHTMTGAGVGGVLTYVPGDIYLAGPYKGAPLSVVAIVPGVAGPFDVGTIVVRIALKFNPLTAEAQADGSASDPIPHILRGIPLKVRDIRVYVDRPEWIFNPTSCEPSSTRASLWGGGQNAFSIADDSPFALAARFQAADCANLAFKPKLSLKLKGGTKRGAHPVLTGTYKPRKGDANLSGLLLRLPHSAFLDQAHIKTICTRVQYAANGGNGGGCPAGSVYGKATAYTPLLEEPLKGPVYLRSSNHNLPDFVASLHGLVDIEAVARIDSKEGGIRASFSNLPDAPITKVVVQMQGAKKGLIVNSTNLCAKAHRADAQLAGQNGRGHAIKPVVGASCGGKAKRKGH